MLLTIPYVLGIAETPASNLVRQIAARGEAVDGALTTYTGDRVRGWLFQPSDRSVGILVVPPKTKLERVPERYRRVIGAQIDEVATQRVDLSAAVWLRHPQLGVGAAHDVVLDSWRGAFAYVEEDQASARVGLRPPQSGAVHAVHSHWSVSDAPATIVMPTGTGKTETMLSVLTSARCTRVLVIVPTDALRTQVAEKFLTLGVLKRQGVSILAEGALHPTVCVLRHIPKTVADVMAIAARAHVIVTTSTIAGQCPPVVQQEWAAQCTHLFIDEAHHAEAPTWRAFKELFRERRVLQFTATPFREDGKPLDGKLIYAYPLRKAQAEGYFSPIRFRNVNEFDPNRVDEAIAAAAIAQLRADRDRGHILMARVDTVARARKVFQLYQQYPEYSPVQLHTGISTKAREEARRKLMNGEARIVVCVDMLGEGFDLPELKIAAFHDIRKTLAVTLQLAGRFTRSRPDLGDATVIANTADVTVRNELRKLYAREPDWNVLLPQFSDAMIGEQQSMQDFLRGFTSFVAEIPLATVRPALSAVVYRTFCEDWDPQNVRTGIPGVSSCEQVHIATNESEHTIVAVTARRVELPWAEVAIHGWQWELYVIFWWPDQNLLFVNGSTNAGEFKGLAQAVAGEDVDMVKGQDVFRAFGGVTRLQLNSVGLTEQLGRNVSFTNRMGADVAPVLRDAQLRRARKSVLAGSGYEGGESVAVGASRKGRIWLHRRARVGQLVAWCKKVGAKLVDATIDPDALLRGTLESKIVNSRPEGMPISVDWPEEIYRSIEAPWSVSVGDRKIHLSDIQLEVLDPTIDGPIRFAVVAEGVRAGFELQYYQRGETSDFRCVSQGDQPLFIIRAETAFGAEQFFTENAPRVWFADGASLDGDEYTPLKASLTPYDRQRILSWSWTGINIRKESQGPTKDQNSVQAAVIARLKSDDYEVIFDDDDAGEAADVVAVRLLGGYDEPTQVAVEFYHCKFSRRSGAGARIDDLYVVCGQAQTSVRWMSSSEKRTDLFTHLLRREAQRRDKGQNSRFERGDCRVVEILREITHTTPVTLKIVVVQPGVSKARISETQLHLLSVTENYLMETYQLPFSVVASE